ncbi:MULTISPECIES: hypothetical protein [unclassified Spirillospora]
MRGYGDREWAVLSQAAALRMVLSQVCARPARRSRAPRPLFAR